MSGINKVILIGNLGRPPEVKQTKTGNTLANLALATSKKWTDQTTGQKHDKTEWHNITVFGKLASIVDQYCQTGSKLYIEGELETQKWQDSHGNDKYITKVIVNGFGGKIEMLDSKSQPAAAQSANVPPPIVTPPEPQPAVAVVGEEPEDDIPF